MSNTERLEATREKRARRGRLWGSKPSATILPFPEKIIVTIVDDQPPEPVPLPIIREPVEFIAAPEQRYPSMQQIIRATASFYGVPVTDIKSMRREVRMTLARHVVMYLARTHTLLSLTIIARLLGDRDHTSVLHGYRRICGLYHTDPELRLAVHAIEKTLGIKQNG
jgi:chromosomal replication initiation ATPase DnaA